MDVSLKSINEKIREDFGRDLYWTRIKFVSDDNSRKTQILTCTSEEYLEDFFEIPGDQKLKEEHLEKWLRLVEKKWSKLGEDIFRQDVHYDVYANTPEGEANGIDFLLKLAK